MVTIRCNIAEEDKEEEGSFNVELFYKGDLIYERDHWGLDEEWKDGSSYSTSSNNISHRKMPAHGTYVLNVTIDSGKNINVDANWSIKILSTSGTTLVSDPYKMNFVDIFQEFETSFTL